MGVFFISFKACTKWDHRVESSNPFIPTFLVCRIFILWELVKN